MYVVRDVGDVYAHLVASFVELAERQGVVEVLGVARVYGKCQHSSEVLASRNLLGCYACVDGARSFFHAFRIAVG